MAATGITRDLVNYLVTHEKGPLLLRDGMVRARSKRSKEDSLPQETGRAKSSRYIVLLKVKRVCRLDQNTVTMALRRVFYSLSLSTLTHEYCAC